MNFASSLRHELAARALEYAKSQALPHWLSYGEVPIVCFAPDERQLRHGNFLRESYKAIQANPAWRGRLAKIHPQGRICLPRTERGLWMELDSCTSSDALLMNIFCHPKVPRSQHVLAMLGVESDAVPHFGYKARVPLANGKFDRTEVDMEFGNLLVEAKLTEGDFQRAEKRVLASYRDFAEVFDAELLRQSETHYLSYQLLRNVLAAHARQASFCVLLDARRPDLIEAWYAVMRCVKPPELRSALRVLTWQELAPMLPASLPPFLASKYGIRAQCPRGSGEPDRGQFRSCF